MIENSKGQIKKTLMSVQNTGKNQKIPTQNRYNIWKKKTKKEQKIDFIKRNTGEKSRIKKC